MNLLHRSPVLYYTYTFLVATVVIHKDGEKDVTVGQGIFAGTDTVIVTPALKELKDKESYSVQSVLGERPVVKIQSEKDYSMLSLGLSVPKGIDSDPKDTKPVEPSSPPQATNTQ